jgi:tetratricopeptide (TPR) repeat protein
MATLSWIERGFADLFLGGIPKDVSVERAAEYFRKAIALNPTHINHHLELGLTLEKLKKKQEATKEYEKAISLPTRDIDDGKYKATAKRRLAALKK